jgi:hypothetical protein
VLLEPGGKHQTTYTWSGDVWIWMSSLSRAPPRDRLAEMHAISVPRQSPRHHPARVRVGTVSMPTSVTTSPSRPRTRPLNSRYRFPTTPQALTWCSSQQPRRDDSVVVFGGCGCHECPSQQSRRDDGAVVFGGSGRHEAGRVWLLRLLVWYICTLPARV